jgi:stress-induced morphogen
MTDLEMQKLLDELKLRFQAHVEAEQVSPGRFRLGVVSPQFAGVPGLRRQDRIWEAIDEILDREQTLDISLVLAYSPDEVEVAPNV